MPRSVIARAGIPCSAAAFVTSGSLAAPSSIEYSVCTCRWTNESALVTGGRAPRWSCVPDRRCVRRATGGEDRRCCALGRDRWGGGSILALPEVYAEGLTERVGSRSGQDPAHRDVRDTRLVVLLADGGVAGPFVEAARSPGRAARPPGSRGAPPPGAARRGP